MSTAEWGWIALIVPGLAIGLAQALQFDVDSLFGALAVPEPSLWLGLAGALLALTMWALRGGEAREQAGDGVPGTTRRLIADTNFITAWVAFAFLAYELGVLLTGIDLARGFALAAPLVPLMAVLVGFIPGCGPQIVVTTLYLSGALPLSAQLGNAISNDGDALFPAIALAPRAALVATLYSAIPAVLVAYATYFVWEAGVI